MRVLDLRAPKPGTSFVAHRSRLALFHTASEAREYWSEYWLDPHARAVLAAAARGELDSGFDVCVAQLARFVSKGSRVLEGGCGLGHVVAALSARGYSAVGVDYVPALVDFARTEQPTLDIRNGDVEALPFDDASFDCYVSLGVLEHFEDGPARAIAEARRVIRPGGIAIIEVPILNQLRRAELERLERVPSARDSAQTFHQYYYAPDDLATELRRGGFHVVDRIPNCWEAVVFREHPIFSRWWDSPLAISPLRPTIRRLVKAMPAPGRLRYAHTMAFVCN